MYSKYKKNYFSQNGEDGIIEKIISDLKITKKLFVCEFGAWDGVFLSNTFNLVKKFNAIALMIEGDGQRFKDLIKTSEKNPSIIPINKYVKLGGQFCLDVILEENNFPNNFDVLSIDIDSNDLEIWESLNNFKPKIVVIEINSGILPGIEQKHDPKNKRQGNSFTSTLIVANKKGYSLIIHTGNLIFLRNDLVNKIKFDQELLSNPDKLFDHSWINDKKKENNIIIRILKILTPKIISKNISSSLKYTIIKFLNKKNN